MGFKSVLKNIWKGTKVALDIGGFINPVIRIIDSGVDAAEAAFIDKQGSGASKHEMVVAMSEPVINALPVPDAKKAEIRVARDKAIIAAVKAKDAAAASKDAYEALDALMDDAA